MSSHDDQDGDQFKLISLEGNAAIKPNAQKAKQAYSSYLKDDNASGTAGLLEAAQYFASNKQLLRRSILFASFSGEELGLLGSDHYVKHPSFPLDKTIAMMNMDMIGLKHSSVRFLLRLKSRQTSLSHLTASRKLVWAMRSAATW